MTVYEILKKLIGCLNPSYEGKFGPQTQIFNSDGFPFTGIDIGETGGQYYLILDDRKPQ